MECHACETLTRAVDANPLSLHTVEEQWVATY